MLVWWSCRHDVPEGFVTSPAVPRSRTPLENNQTEQGTAELIVIVNSREDKLLFYVIGFFGIGLGGETKLIYLSILLFSLGDIKKGSWVY